jgi:hypothetical protein
MGIFADQKAAKKIDNMLKTGSTFLFLMDLGKYKLVISSPDVHDKIIEGDDIDALVEAFLTE